MERKPQNIEVIYLKDYEGVPKYYVNTARIMSNLYDFAFLCGNRANLLTHEQENQAEAATVELKIDPQAILYMSPTHAKSFAKLLNDQIRQYEEENGPIPQGKSEDSDESAG